MKLRIVTPHGRVATSSDIYRMLGLPTNRLPDHGLPVRLLQGIPVWVEPARETGQRAPHRVMAQCPWCSQKLSVGRLHQHVCRNFVIKPSNIN